MLKIYLKQLKWLTCCFLTTTEKTRRQFFLFVFETVCEFHKLRKNEVSTTSLGLLSPPNLRSGPKALSSVTVLFDRFRTSL